MRSNIQTSLNLVSKFWINKNEIKQYKYVNAGHVIILWPRQRSGGHRPRFGGKDARKRTETSYLRVSSFLDVNINLFHAEELMDAAVHNQYWLMLFHVEKRLFLNRETFTRLRGRW